MATDPYWDCPECGKQRAENPCEHCGDLYVPKAIVPTLEMSPEATMRRLRSLLGKD